MIRLTIWNENYHEKTNDYVRALHPDGIHMTLAKGMRIRSFSSAPRRWTSPNRACPTSSSMTPTSSSGGATRGTNMSPTS